MPAKGWVPSAATRARRADTIAAKRFTPLHRFNSKVEPDLNGGCWLWSGTIIPGTGYGQMEVDGRAISAHRLSYQLHKGEIPPDMQVCHRCDVRSCVNPAHLFLGSHQDNMRDMRVKGRAARLVGEESSSAKISEPDIPKILARLLIGHTCAQIAADYGVTDCAINAIRRGKSWNHVTGLPRVRGVLGDGKGGGEGHNLSADAA